MPDKHRSETSPDSDKPIYNDNPLFLRGHLESLYEWLPAENSNHLNLAGGYFMVVNRKTIVMSAEQAAAIKDCTLATPTDFRATFIKPVVPTRWKATTTPLPSADAERFSIQPEAIRKGLNEMLSDIVSSFEDTESAKDAKKEAGNCPITLLNQLKDEADNITNTMVGKIDDLMSKMMEDGLASPTLSGFSQFRKGYTALNLALHDDETLSDAKLAKRLAKVVRSLGTVADTALRFEMLKRTADGNLALTIKACKTVLGDMEANDKGGALGAALTAGGRRDPSIFPPGGGGGTPSAPGGGDRKKGHPDRPFDASRDRNCFNCKTGEHWTADCNQPRRDSAKAQKAAKWKERRDKEESKREAAAATAPSPAPAAHGKAGRGSGPDDTADTAMPVLIQDAEERLAAAFSAGGTVNFAEQIAWEAYDCSSESESEGEEEYEQADHFGQANMGLGVQRPSVPPQPPTPPPPPPNMHVTPSHPAPESDSNEEQHGQTVQTFAWQQTWQQTRAAVASLDSNPTMGAIRDTITSTGLPVSPGTGGLARRTKVHIVAELRSMVGLSPLSAPVEMGIAIEATPPPPPELAPSPAQTDSPAVPAPAPAAPAGMTMDAGKQTRRSSALSARIARMRSARIAWPRMADALRAKRGTHFF